MDSHPKRFLRLFYRAGCEAIVPARAPFFGILHVKALRHLARKSQAMLPKKAPSQNAPSGDFQAFVALPAKTRTQREGR
jgi:hypothetical protein